MLTISLPFLPTPHGPFTWGLDPHNAVHNTVVLEELTFMTFHTETINPGKETLQQEILDKHYLRRQNKNTYYGQYLISPP